MGRMSVFRDVDAQLCTARDGRGATVGHVLFLVLVCAVLFLTRTARLPLADPEESRCALIVREMLQTGRWITPHLNGKPYFDKPAPFFWLAAAGQYLTGSAELGGRLVPAVSGLLAVLVTYAFGRRLFGPTAGLVGALVLATSGEFLFMARWYRMDMPFAAAMWAAVWWFYRTACGPAGQVREPTRRYGPIGFYLFAALATLFKGPAGLGLPLLILLVWFGLTGRWRYIITLLHPLGIAVYVLIAAPWYLAVCVRQPDYAYEFFVRQNLLRYAGGGDFGHSWPGILYVPVLLAGLLPWTIYLPGAIIRHFPRRWRQVRQADEGVTLLWVAAIIITVFFAFSSTKLVSYVLPAFAPLAVLIGGFVGDWMHSRKPDRLMRLGAGALGATCLVLPVVLVGIEVWLGGIDTWIVLPAALGSVAALSLRAAAKTLRPVRVFAWGFAAVFGTLLFLLIHTAPVAYERLSTRSLVGYIPSGYRGRYVYCWPGKKLSFIYYAAPIVGGRKWIRSVDLPYLCRQLAGEQDVYCLIIGDESIEKLRSQCPKAVCVLGRSGEDRLVTNATRDRTGLPATR